MTKVQRERERANRKGLDRQLAIVADEGLTRSRRKRAARLAAALGEKLGLIVRPQACQWCRRRLRLERHHPDHSRPLAITFLCADCHQFADGLARSAASA